MKTKFLCLFTLISFLAFQKANATIWRVNNNGFSASFTSLQQANDDNNVLNGDTIHMESSPIDYSGASISKKLIIIGTGFFLSQNPNTSNNLLEAIIFYIQFNDGSAGSQLIGVHIQSSNGIDISVSNILIKRCRIDAHISLIDRLSDIIITQNFFEGQSASSVISASSNGFPANVVFNNNICQKTLILPDGYALSECRNNVFDCPAISGKPSIKMLAGAFENNILKTTNATVDINNGTNNNVSYNIGTSANNQFGTANNNIVVANMDNLFADAAANSPDGDYQLKPGSAGSNNGSDGTGQRSFWWNCNK